jgi:4-diphosphocytidyl-2-C-methyl-D-erythritol kinase
LARFAFPNAMRLEKKSPCKVNLILNILGKRADGFHELETVMQPVNLCDEMTFERAAAGLQLSCSHPELPTDSKNLVHRAASAFLAAANIADGVRIHLEKKLPLAGGIGGGSANAAVTFTALNELFDSPLPLEKLHELAAALGSDVPFFLHDQPALATGRGEKVRLLENFPALRGKAFFLVHPGFGISTPWSYQNLARFPEALNGKPGRARELISKLQADDLPAAAGGFYNSLEAPAFDKFPVLSLYKEFLREHGALVSLMSGSGSTTFAIAENLAAAENLAEKFKSRFGDHGWTAAVAV